MPGAIWRRAQSLKREIAAGSVRGAELLAAIPASAGARGSAAGEAEPTPGEGLPPGQAGCELGWAASGEPEVQRQSDAVVVASAQALLQLGCSGEDGLPEPSGPAEM